MPPIPPPGCSSLSEPLCQLVKESIGQCVKARRRQSPIDFSTIRPLDSSLWTPVNWSICQLVKTRVQQVPVNDSTNCLLDQIFSDDGRQVPLDGRRDRVARRDDGVPQGVGAETR